MIPPQVLPAKGSTSHHADMCAFSEFSRVLLARRISSIVTFIVLTTFLFWGSDFLFHRGESEFLSEASIMRFGVVVLSLGLGALGRWTSVVERHPEWVVLAWVSAGFFAIGWQISPLGDPGSHYFGTLYFCSLFTLILALPLSLRIASCLLIAAAALGGYVARSPEYLHDPFMGPTLGQLLFSTSLCVLFGHLAYRTNLRSFLSKRRLEDKTRETDDLNAQLADLVAKKTSDLRTLTTGLETTVLDERALMAREIHDQLGQDLNAMRYTLAFARRSGEDSSSISKSTFEELDTLLDRTRDSMQRILARLRPRVLDEHGFLAAIRWLIEDFDRQTSIRSKLMLDLDEEQISGKSANALFRILQEGLSNVGRHAQATEVRIKLEMKGETVFLTIEDDGKGMPPKSEASDGVGMIGIRERAEAEGGTARWSPQAVSGTRVQVEIPIPGLAGGEQAS